MERDTSLSTAGPEADTEVLIEKIERFGHKIRSALSQIGKVNFGQSDFVDLSLVTLLAGGHAYCLEFRVLSQMQTRPTVAGVR